ncbi:hypothetical protein JKG47_10305, partial [Acidithiobacillus sp. MC6.1]|nr:hypothetical protein [Acidithiobacillus sp. MC6.1]
RDLKDFMKVREGLVPINDDPPSDGWGYAFHLDVEGIERTGFSGRHGRWLRVAYSPSVLYAGRAALPTSTSTGIFPVKNLQHSSKRASQSSALAKNRY